MKPVPFAIQTPETIEEAVTLLASAGEDDEVKVLAGGQSLVPLLNFRLAAPDLLVDINRIPQLSFIRASPGGLAIGAMTRQGTLERSADVARLAPLLAQALPFVAHRPIRNRGTLGGSVAHADPSAELCAAMLALEATVVAVGSVGDRELSVQDFFTGPFMTALAPDELLTEIRIPRQPRGGCAFDEVTRRRGDFAVAGVAGVLSLDDNGRIAEARLAYTSMGPTPLRAYGAEAALRGREPTTETFAEAAKLSVTELGGSEDLHASREYRRHIAEILTRRVLARSLARAIRRSESMPGIRARAAAGKNQRNPASDRDHINET
jgi:carbon-monoxide dehydrogenase medium subunit